MSKVAKQDLIYRKYNMGLIFTEPTKGSIIIIECTNLLSYKFPILKGCLEIDNCNIDNIIIPDRVVGDIYLTNCNVNNILLPKVKGNLILDNCIISKLFKAPEVDGKFIIR